MSHDEYDELAMYIASLRAPGARLRQRAEESNRESTGLQQLEAVARDLRERYPLPSDRPTLTVIHGGLDA